MVIYGSALIGICLIAGNIIGELLGVCIGVDTNVGGVGFAMLMLILACSYLMPEDKMKKETSDGLIFWQNMYIPVVIAMTASQDVIGALKSGWTALLGGLLVVLCSFALLPVLSRERKKDKAESEGEGV